MNGEGVSISISDNEIWEQKRARLKALESANRPQHTAETKYSVYLQVCRTAKEGNIEEFIETVDKCSAKESVFLSDIIDIKGPSRNSLLHIAAGIEKVDILQALLEVIPNIELTTTNTQGDTALHIAARAGRIGTAELLLCRSMIVDMVNDAGSTALHEAVKNHHYDMTRLLLNKGSRSVYQKNKESKSPLYLAVETGELEILRLLVKAVKELELPTSQIEGMSPVHGAVIYQRKDMLEAMLESKELFDLRDGRGGTPLHLAAYMNYTEGVDFLVCNFASSVFEGDEEGYLPIHIACKMGHVPTTMVLLRLWPHLEDLLDLKDGQNVLHVAIKYGQDWVASYILSDPTHKKLINGKDKEGNTPLHVATLQSRVVVLAVLVLWEGVDLQLVNNGNLTALDIADEQRKITGGPWEEAIYGLLRAAGARRSVDEEICRPKRLEQRKDVKPKHLDRLKEVVNTRMVVATLIAAMTFAAGFSVPGGYNDSGQNAGFATQLNKPMYDVFVIFNSVGLCSSLIAVAFLHWSETSSWDKMVGNIRTARTSVVTALAATSVAYMAGVYVTVCKHAWMAAVTLIIGTITLFVILGLHIVLTPRNLFKFVIVLMSIQRRMVSVVYIWPKIGAKLYACTTTGQKASAGVEP